MATRPLAKDAANASQPIEVMARVAARMGENDRAIAALKEILSRPGAARWRQAWP